MKDKRSLIGHLSCFVAYAIFGVNIITSKDLTTGNYISPLAIFTMRAIGAGLLFWIISFFTPKEKVDKKDFLKILAASVLGFFIVQYAFLRAIPQVTPMDCSILSVMTPIYTMIIAAIVLKEPITFKKAGGVILSFAGVVFLIFNSVHSGGATETTLEGTILMLINTLSFALYLGIFKPLISKYSVVTFMKWIFLFSFLLTIPFTAKEIFTIDYAAIPGTAYFDLGFLIVFATFVTYFLIPVGQKSIRPTLVSMYSYVQPIIATAMGIALGMDNLTWQKVLAAVTVFTGVVIVSFSKSAEQKS